ncbi:26459_t:CDS:1 [Dentiscutata erythropus]|uniref:26459_t:CDS:1 n=1 Tax=Dentiscutata erythropus TaxID=1348616 RepID=A0A9N8VW14_9GLOM|nr:26459_t:CDS:1 [Dentiscutata erythropus]
MAFNTIHSENERHVMLSGPINKIIPGEHVMEGHSDYYQRFIIKEITNVIMYNFPTRNGVCGWIRLEGENGRHKIRRDKYKEFYCYSERINLYPYSKKFIYDKYYRICDLCVKFIRVKEYEVRNIKCKYDDFCSFYDTFKSMARTTNTIHSTDKSCPCSTCNINRGSHYHNLCLECGKIKDGKRVDEDETLY